MILPVILSGGAGTRLWPLSTPERPKQFLNLFSDKTLLQETALRVRDLPGFDVSNPLVVCNEKHLTLVRAQLDEIDLAPRCVILEPIGRNTAPAIAASALKALEIDNDALLLVLPSDHYIGDVKAFQMSFASAIDFALKGFLLTFGIVPSKPAIGYGYIKVGEDKGGAFCVDRFVEKPDLKTAQGYLEQGGYFWNSGMFLFKASHYLSELERFAPDILQGTQKAIKQARIDEDVVRLPQDLFSKIRALSVDYAVMEKTKDALVVPLNASWNDVGTWEMLFEVGQSDFDARSIVGELLTVMKMKEK